VQSASVVFTCFVYFFFSKKRQQDKNECMLALGSLGLHASYFGFEQNCVCDFFTAKKLRGNVLIMGEA